MAEKRCGQCEVEPGSMNGQWLLPRGSAHSVPMGWVEQSVVGEKQSWTLSEHGLQGKREPILKCR